MRRLAITGLLPERLRRVDHGAETANRRAQEGNAYLPQRTAQHTTVYDRPVKRKPREVRQKYDQKRQASRYTSCETMSTLAGLSWSPAIMKIISKPSAIATVTSSRTGRRSTLRLSLLRPSVFAVGNWKRSPG